jgi:protein TonB
MNRWTDLLASFGVAVLLHGLLVLGAVWFWTLRSPELRPMFQGGDVSLAVTFVAAAPTPERFPLRPDTRLSGVIGTSAGQVGGQVTDSAVEPLPEEDENQDMLDAETAASVSAQAPANAPEDRRRTTDDGQQTTDSAAEPPSDALRQGVSGAVRRKSEIRPYYPLGARLRGEEGAVTVRVWVNGSGRARRCEVARSSGYPVLDEAAVDAARRARYVSTQPGAWRAEAETTLTFRFRLTE